MEPKTVVMIVMLAMPNGDSSVQVKPMDNVRACRDAAERQDLAALRRMQLQLGQAHDMQLLLDWTAGVVMKLPVAQRAAVAAFADRSARSLDRRMAAFVRRHPDAGV